MTWKEILRTFCEDVSADIDKQITQSSDDSESIVLLYAYKEKSSSIQSEISTTKGEKKWEQHGSKILKDISQLVLDLTYLKEVQLVDDDFSVDTAEFDIKYIVDTLSSLEILAKNLCPDADVLSCLGAEIVECLRWRKGALMYMFAHTVYHRHPAQGIPRCQLHYLEEGVDYLVSMLKTRCDAEWLESCDQSCDEQPFQDNGDTLQLIHEGIFSDTHLLALMYCGEMCYWHTTSSSSSCPKPGSGNTSPPASDTGGDNSKSDSGLNPAMSCENNRNSVRKAGDSDIHHHGNCDQPLELTSFDRKTDFSDLQHTKIDNDGVSGSESCSSASAATAAGNITASLDSCGKSEKNAQSKSSDSNVGDNKGQKGSGSRPAFKMVQIGNVCLKRYLSVAKGPLASAGWSTDRAEDIIIQFTRLDLV